MLSISLNIRKLLYLVIGLVFSFQSVSAKNNNLSDVFELGNFSTKMMSNSMESYDYLISYGEKIEFNFEIAANVTWTIKNTNNIVVAFGTGDSLLRHVFNIPGSYQIDIVEPHNHDDDCGHIHLPEKISVKVSGVRMTYMMNTVTISKEIVGGQETEGTTLTVDVFVELFDNIPKVFPYTTFQSAGVKTTIEGTLTNPNFLLKNGINMLEFSLSGTALSSTYIMFDFLDYNGNVQGYYIPYQIK